MIRLTALLVVLSLVAAAPVCAETVIEENHAPRQYTFAWPYSADDDMRPRGGTSKGPAIHLVTTPSDAWLKLTEPGLSAKQRDRRAILAMAGGYRASFDFIETAGFTPGYTPGRPYQSWGTEFVYVLSDEPDFISLQHILVMFVDNDEGETQGPIVVKHWRQDWHYEDRDIHAYAGNNTWRRQSISAKEARGTWSQAVYQVDDSPRYQARGTWEHTGNYSSWESNNTWRPLPRREFSVRDDYQVLSGTNRHTITPTGWVHEEDNLKVALDGKGQPRAEQPVVAREVGLNRYERISGHDFGAGDEYWRLTQKFWSDVRQGWDHLFEQHGSITLKSKVNDKRLFEVLFEYAGLLEEGNAYDPAASRKFVNESLAAYLD